MNINSKLCAVSSLALILAYPDCLSAAPLKSTKVMQGAFKQCEYVDGVIIRILASRDCPNIETTPPSMPVPASTAATIGAVNEPSAQPRISVHPVLAPPSTQPATNVGRDIILEKAMTRCSSIGFKRETSEFRSCVTDQITLLSK